MGNLYAIGAVFRSGGHSLWFAASPHAGCDRLLGHVREISTGGGGGWGGVIAQWGVIEA